MGISTPRGVIPITASGAMRGDSFAPYGLPNGPFEIDLTAITFASPPGIVALAAYIDALDARGLQPARFLAPADANVANYLSRACVGDLLDERNIVHNLRSVHHRNLGTRMVELTQFTGSEEIQTLAESVYDFAEQTKAGSGGPLFVAICEAGENVGFHAGRPLGFTIAQYFPIARAFEFAIGDAGQGFLGSLRGRGATDHLAAIRLAIEPGVSGTGISGRGYGLSAIVTEIESLGGSVSFLSGDAELMRTQCGESSRVMPGLVPGTTIYGRFNSR